MYAFIFYFESITLDKSLKNRISRICLIWSIMWLNLLHYACAISQLIILIVNLFALCLKVNAFPITFMFGMCSIFLFVASILQRRLAAIGDKPSEFFFFFLDGLYTIMQHQLFISLHCSKLSITNFYFLIFVFILIFILFLWQRQKIGPCWRKEMPRMSHWMLLDPNSLDYKNNFGGL